MQIHELNSLSRNPQADDVFAIDTGTDTAKIDYDTLAKAIIRNGGTITGTLVLSKTQDASGTADNGPALVVGGTRTTQHLELDGNEIMAKSDGTSVGTLNVNIDGGNVVIGKQGDTNYNVDIKSTQESTSRTTGALVVRGGVGVNGKISTTDLQVNNGLKIMNETTASTDVSRSIMVGKVNTSTGTSGNYTYTVYPGEWGRITVRFRHKAVNNSTSNTTWAQSRMYFKIWSAPDSQGTRLDYGETYYLPICEAGLTEDKTYDILTSKSPVTVAQGGTGSSSASGARTNLSVYSKTETDSAIQQSTANKAFGGYIDESTWSALWTNCLSKITQSQIGFVGIFSDNAASVLSNGKITSLIGATIYRSGSDSIRTFRVMAMSSNGQYQYSWQITSATSSSRTTGTVYRFTGTAL